MKCEGGTRQEAGYQGCTPISSHCFGPSLYDIHFLWTYNGNF